MGEMGGETSGAGESGPGRRPAPDSMELVRLGRAGDRAALNAFLMRYRPRLLRVVGIRMGAFLRRHGDPEDIVQETFMVAVRRLPELRAEVPSGVMCWLTKISDHVASNLRERLQAKKRDPAREQRLRNSDPPSSSDGGLVIPAKGPSPSEVISRREEERRLDACVESLEPEAYRQVILLRDYMGADWSTIALELGRSGPDAVRELHRRAREKLRERLT